MTVEPSTVEELIDAAELGDALTPDRRAALSIVLLVHQACRTRGATIWDQLRQRLMIAATQAEDNAGLYGGLLHQMTKVVGDVNPTNRQLPDLRSAVNNGDALAACSTPDEIELVIAFARVTIAADKQRRTPTAPAPAAQQSEQLLHEDAF